MSRRVTRSEARHRQQLSTTIQDPSKPPANGKCMWWSLHREVRENVLRLAYCRDRDAPMKPIMGVDFLRDEIGFVTTDRRRGKLPQLPSTFTHYTSHFLVSKKWHDEALQIFFSTSEFDLTRRNRIFNFISPHASPSGIHDIRFPLPYLQYLTAIRVRMSEILCAGVGLLSKACPHLGRIEIHAEARDFEGEWFDEVVAAAADTGYNTRQIKEENETNSSSNNSSSNEASDFLSSLSGMTSTFASRRSARIWRESLTAKFLLRTRWYAEIKQLSGLQEATLMLTQKRWFWEGHTPAEETNFSFNLWKIRRVFLLSATRPKWGRSDLLRSLGGHEIGYESEEREPEEDDFPVYGPPERNDVTARL